MLKFDNEKYQTTVKIIMLKAIYDLYPKFKVELKYSLNHGLYGEVFKSEDETVSIDYSIIKERMKEIIALDFPINLVYSDEEKIRTQIKDREDIRSLLLYNYFTGIKGYELDGYVDYFYTPPYKTTASVSNFDIYSYNDGFILKTPINDINNMKEVVNYSKLASIFKETSLWNKILGVSTVGSVNEKVINGDISLLIRINETLHEKNLSLISNKITENRNIKLVTVAGPSSSGKTTFSKKLDIHLRANEIEPIIVSLDNYYIGRENIPIGSNGLRDFEHLEALDLKLLNENLKDLIEGREADIPIYNFKTGKREETFNRIKIPKNGLLIIEGIHGLNERLTESIPKENKYKIYISCLTQINLDSHNRVATSDVRKIRRIVRDRLSRDTSVEETLEMWSSVRAGEEKNIFPFQEEADILFNSNLTYEIGVLKNYAIKELLKVPSTSKHYKEAKRLVNLISAFVPIENELVPDVSLLKEFIGNSFFYNY